MFLSDLPEDTIGWSERPGGAAESLLAPAAPTPSACVAPPVPPAVLPCVAFPLGSWMGLVGRLDGLDPK